MVAPKKTWEITKADKDEGFPDSSVGKESPCNAGDLGSIPGSGRSPGEGIGCPLQYSWASLVAQLVKNPSAMQRTQGSNPGLGRSPGEGKGYPLQSSGLENSIDCIVHAVAKSHNIVHPQNTSVPRMAYENKAQTSRPTSPVGLFCQVDSTSIVCVHACMLSRVQLFASTSIKGML